jgi:hypothetical protein
MSLFLLLNIGVLLNIELYLFFLSFGETKHLIVSKIT